MTSVIITGTTVQAYAGTSTIRVEFNPSLSGELILFGDTNINAVKQTVVVTADTGGGTFADSMTTNVAENTITTVTNCTGEISQSLAQSPGGADTQVMLKGIKVGGDILFDASGRHQAGQRNALRRQADCCQRQRPC